MTLDRPLRIAPSLLAADFANLERDVKRVEDAGADWLHLDVMDGHFVPNLTIGPAVVAAVHRVARVPLDVHLMIEDPWRFAAAFVDAGTATLTFHLEVARRRPDDALALLESLKTGGTRVGLALNPDHDVDLLAPFLPVLDQVLVMSVFPGFGGQRFMPEVLDGLGRLARDPAFGGEIAIDGGIGPATIGRCAEAGANIFVAGTAIFGADDLAARIAELRRRAGG